MKAIARSLLSLATAGALAASFVPLAYAAPAFDGADAEGSSESVGVIVVLEQSADGIGLLSEGVAGALESEGIAVTDEIDAGDRTVLVAEPTDGATDEEAAAAASQLPGVAYAQPDYVYELIDGVADSEASAFASDSGDGASLLASSLFNDPIAKISNSTATPNQYWLYDASLDEAWEQATTDGDVVVATFDSGALLSHEDLRDNLLSNLAWDAYHDVALDVAVLDGGDVNGHGTHVAGIIAGVANNGVGIAGASYNAKILPIKVVSDAAYAPKSSTSALMRAYFHLFDLIDDGAVDNVRVVNMSLGYYREPGDQNDNDDALEATIEQALDDYGIVSVCAAGNGNERDAANTGRILPADFDACVAVTALEDDGTNIVWSDYNEYKDISAPGRNLWSTYISESSAAGGYYHAQSGTSMASPVVSGTIALLFAAAPSATAEEVIEAVYDTANPVVDEENDRTATSGSHGAIDAGAAVESLMEKLPFPDVASADWFAEAAAYASEHGIMNGYGPEAGANEGHFGPHDVASRSVMAQIIYNYYGNGEIAPAPEGINDVAQDAWYTKAVNWVIAEGCMTGFDGTGEFRPDDPLTREQLAIVLDNLSAVETVADPGALYELPDVDDASGWAIDALEWAVGNGVINGFEESVGYFKLNPQDPATRCMVAQVFMNSIERGIL